MQQVTGSVTLDIDAKAKAMKSAGCDIVSFGAGEPDFDTPAHIVEAGVRAMRGGETRYTPASGTQALKTAVCDKLMRRNGLRYAQNQIVVSNGAKQALGNACFALLSDGDEAILITPCWVSYAELIKMAGGVPVLVQRDRNKGFALDLGALEDAVSDRTKLIMLNSPDNPCGNVFTREEIEGVAHIAKKHDLYIVSDEIYEDFIYDCEQVPSIASLSEDAYNRTILVNGVSKTYAMTGWRLGYSACAASVAAKMGDWQSHMTGNVNSIAQAAAVEALCGDQGSVTAMVAEFKARRNEMVRRVREMPYLTCHVPAGAFYVMADITQTIGLKANGVPITDSKSFTSLLLEQAEVAVVPGYAFFAENMIRLSYALSMSDLHKGLDKMRIFMQNLQK
jgi:aspartate aminotransferase